MFNHAKKSSVILCYQHIQRVAQKNHKNGTISRRSGEDFLSLCFREDRTRCRENKGENEDGQDLIVAFAVELCLAGRLQSK